MCRSSFSHPQGSQIRGIQVIPSQTRQATKARCFFLPFLVRVWRRKREKPNMEKREIPARWKKEPSESLGRKKKAEKKVIRSPKRVKTIRRKASRWQKE